MDRIENFHDKIPKDEELYHAVEKGDAEQILEANSDILMAEMIEFERQKWRDNRLCSCGADSYMECECDLTKDQVVGWKKRTSRKMNEKFGDRAMTILLQKTKRGLHRKNEEGGDQE